MEKKDPYKPLKDLTEEQRKEIYDFAIQRSEDILHGREEIKTKVCYKCKEEKNIEEFYKDRRTKDKLHWYCKKCNSKYNMIIKERYKQQNLINLPQHTTLKCSTCKKEKLVKYFSKEISTITGYRLICKKCTNKRRLKTRNNSVEKRYKQYKKDTLKRNFVPIFFEQFQEITSQPCFYCGGWNDYELKFTGIDRVDNSKGYEENNIVPCCKVCNVLKGRFSRRAFIRACKKIARYTKGKGLDGRKKEIAKKEEDRQLELHFSTTD